MSATVIFVWVLFWIALLFSLYLIHRSEKQRVERVRVQAAIRRERLKELAQKKMVK